MADIKLPGGISIGAGGVKVDSNRAINEAARAQAEAAKAQEQAAKKEAQDRAAVGNYKLVPGEPSELAANIEKFMAANKLPANGNGVISITENTALRNFLGRQTQNRASGLKEEITFGQDGSITFTPKALGLLDIEVPKATAPAAQQAPAAPAPTTQAPATPNPVDAAKDAAGKVGAAAGSLWEKAKAAGRELTKCTTENHPEYGSQACVDVRQKQKDQEPQR